MDSFDSDENYYQTKSLNEERKKITITNGLIYDQFFFNKRFLVLKTGANYYERHYNYHYNSSDSD